MRQADRVIRDYYDGQLAFDRKDVQKLVCEIEMLRSNRGQDTVQVTIPGVPPGADTI